MLDKPVQYIKGIGPKRAKTLQNLNIYDLRGLLYHFPRTYEDRRKITAVKDILFDGKVCVKGIVKSSSESMINRSMSIFSAEISDGSGTANAVFFRKKNPYFKHDVFEKYKNDFKDGASVMLYGSAEYGFGKLQLKPDDYEVITDEKHPLERFNRIMPVYDLTEGINQKWLREVIQRALNENLDSVKEFLPENILQAELFPSEQEALASIHFPAEPEDAEKARQKLAFEEFLILETALELFRAGKVSAVKNRTYEVKKTLLTPFRKKLGFEFTAAQKKVINEIFRDMLSEKPMSRLLIGDVGSGKTVVALSAMLLARENGYQSALIAPTEILAEQHYMTIKNMLEGLDVRIELVTGGTRVPASRKKTSIKNIEENKADMVVGTHALLEKHVKFAKLGLVVIDEQHRFGVIQRGNLMSKAASPDVLVMTATPIPRTLALTVYGDLDLSVIDSLPEGRQPIQTLHVSEPEAYERVKKEIASGHQVYIVYPLVEESDKTELKAAVKEATALSQGIFKSYKVGLLHGQLPAKDKEKAMMDFRSGKFQVLIATTVIEVGIDVPNATTMVIEHADRFGLSTLHQLRGRVGRGPNRSWCLLLGTPKTDTAKRRIEVMKTNSSGFVIADEDLKIRGPGEVFGTAQHGLPEFKAGNILTDIKLIEKARSYSKAIISGNGGRNAVENRELMKAVFSTYGKKFNLAKIS